MKEQPTDNISPQVFGAPVTAKESQKKAAHGEFVVAKPLSGQVVTVQLPASDIKRIGDRVTVCNEGAGVVVVTAAAHSNIDGSIAYPIIGKGTHVFVQVDNKRFARIGEKQPGRWPHFGRDASDTSLVVTANQMALPYPLAIYLNDGSLRISMTSLECDLDKTGLGGRVSTESVATGLWHVFAVPDGDYKFALILSKAATPATDDGGPSGYSAYRYMWTVRCTGTGGTVIQSFFQAKQWYMPTDRGSLDDKLVAVSAGQPTNSTWNQLDGSALAGSGSTKDIFAVVPISITRSVRLAPRISTTDDNNVLIHISTGTVATPGTSIAGGSSAASTGISTGTGAGYTSPSDRGFIEETLPLSASGLIVGFTNVVNDITADVMLRGYENSRWGID